MRSRHLESWSLIQYLAGKSNLSWSILEDINDLIFADEKRGLEEVMSSLLTDFGDAIKDNGLMDLGFVGEKYTWEKSRGRVNWMRERLDRAFANHEWRELFLDAEMRVLEVTTSDHLPTCS